jgi:hypothetical protein
MRNLLLFAFTLEILSETMSITLMPGDLVYKIKTV